MQTCRQQKKNNQPQFKKLLYFCHTKKLYIYVYLKKYKCHKITTRDEREMKMQRKN